MCLDSEINLKFNKQKDNFVTLSCLKDAFESIFDAENIPI